MRVAAVVLLACGALAGCGQTQSADRGPLKKEQGRYAGIGTFPAGRLWSEMAVATSPADPTAAILQDDENIIVVIDSQSGEVRQCGDHSGFCVRMNPWTGAGARSAAPVKLKKHAADLQNESGSDDAGSAAVTNGEAATR
jgi:hypothetical protein